MFQLGRLSLLNRALAIDRCSNGSDSRGEVPESRFQQELQAAKRRRARIADFHVHGDRWCVFTQLNLFRMIIIPGIMDKCNGMSN